METHPRLQSPIQVRFPGTMESLHSSRSIEPGHASEPRHGQLSRTGSTGSIRRLLSLCLPRPSEPNKEIERSRHTHHIALFLGLFCSCGRLKYGTRRMTHRFEPNTLCRNKETKPRSSTDHAATYSSKVCRDFGLSIGDPRHHDEKSKDIMLIARGNRRSSRSCNMCGHTRCQEASR